MINNPNPSKNHHFKPSDAFFIVIWEMQFSILQCMIERCEKDQNCKLQFQQQDYWPCHSLDFRTVFEIMIIPFSSCKIGKMWDTNKEVNKPTNKKGQFQFPQPDYRPRPDSSRTVFWIMIGPFSSCKIKISEMSIDIGWHIVHCTMGLSVALRIWNIWKCKGLVFAQFWSNTHKSSSNC